MKGLVGVRRVGIPSRQEILFFDSVVLGGSQTAPEIALHPELQYLQENDAIYFEDTTTLLEDGYAQHELFALQGLVQKYNRLQQDSFIYEKDKGRSSQWYMRHRYGSRDNLEKEITEYKQRINNTEALINDARTRFLSSYLRERFEADIVPILTSYPTLKKPDMKETEVIQLILNHFPIPSEDSPWEQILDVRQDTDARHKLLALRRWIRSLIRENRSKTEIEEELEFLLYEYEKRMKLHRMKYNAGAIQTIITLPFEIAENVLKLRELYT